MKVSVVIPAWNEEKRLAKCLQSLLNQEEPADEIIVVDNNSSDQTVTIAKSFGVKVIHVKKQGISYARNAGFNAARFAIIARTDADTVVPTNWIKQIKADFQNRRLAAVSGPAYFYKKLPLPFHVSHLLTLLVFKLLNKILKQHSLFGPNMAIRRTTWQKIKSLVCNDNKLVHEDLDLGMHLKKHNAILFDTSLVVETSSRRWRRPGPYVEYLYRLIKMIRAHQKQVKAGQ